MKARPQSGNVSMTEFMEFQHKLPDLLNRKQLSQTHYGVGNALALKSSSLMLFRRCQTATTSDSDGKTSIQYCREMGIP